MFKVTCLVVEPELESALGDYCMYLFGMYLLTADHFYTRWSNPELALSYRKFYVELSVTMEIFYIALPN